MMLVRAEAIRSLPVALAATAWFGHVPAEAGRPARSPIFTSTRPGFPRTRPE